jgi:tRNA G18 (ribose-2'-O)-methylase SpoU
MISANDSESITDVLLDNIRSSHNVGSIFRSCDGVGINHVHLCGITSTPRNVKVSKTALGAGQTVPWTYYRNSIETVRRLKEFGYCIWALESTASGKSIFDVTSQAIPERIVVVVGNEQSGVDPGIMALSDRIITLPMTGVKSSLNVAVALGVAVYWIRYGLGKLAIQS